MDTSTAEIQAKIGDWFKGGFNLYKDNFVLIFIATIILVVLSFASILIAAGPLFIGLLLILFRLIDKSEPAPTVGDIFQGFNYFKASFLFMIVCAVINWLGSLILGYIPSIGGILSYAYSTALSALLMFGLPLIADKKLEFWPAMELSIETVKPKFFQFLIFSFIGSLVTASGFLLLGVGILITGPFYICSIAVAYKDIFRQNTVTTH